VLFSLRRDWEGEQAMAFGFQFWLLLSCSDSFYISLVPCFIFMWTGTMIYWNCLLVGVEFGVIKPWILMNRGVVALKWLINRCSFFIRFLHGARICMQWLACAVNLGATNRWGLPRAMRCYNEASNSILQYPKELVAQKPPPIQDHVSIKANPGLHSLFLQRLSTARVPLEPIFYPPAASG